VGRRADNGAADHPTCPELFGQAERCGWQRLRPLSVFPRAECDARGNRAHSTLTIAREPNSKEVHHSSRQESQRSVGGGDFEREHGHLCRIDGRTDGCRVTDLTRRPKNGDTR
jgi:hypothetical protein